MRLKCPNPKCGLIKDKTHCNVLGCGGTLRYCNWFGDEYLECQNQKCREKFGITKCIFCGSEISVKYCKVK